MLLFYNISPLRFSNSPVTPQRTSKSGELLPDTCSWPLEVTNNSTCSSRPLSPVEESSLTSIRISSLDRPLETNSKLEMIQFNTSSFLIFYLHLSLLILSIGFLKIKNQIQPAAQRPISCLLVVFFNFLMESPFCRYCVNIQTLIFKNKIAGQAELCKT